MGPFLHFKSAGEHKVRPYGTVTESLGWGCSGGQNPDLPGSQPELREKRLPAPSRSPPATQ